MDRLERQRRLPEVGPAGEARLAAARAVVRGREGALVELAYLERAGLGSVELRPREAPAEFPHGAALLHPASREVAAGAWRALRTIRGVLGVGAP